MLNVTQKAQVWFYLTTALCPKLYPNHLLFTGKLKTNLYICLLDQGDLAGTARFQSIMV